jgi:AcrR family transcriptional regulator
MERKQEETRRRILSAARALFLREAGYEKTSVRDIAGRADVSVGGVYLHFKSKPEILVALVEEFLAGTNRDFVQASSEGGTGAEKLELFLERFKRFATPAEKESHLFIQFLNRMSADPAPAVQETLVPFVSGFIDMLCGIIELGARDGSLPAVVVRNPRKMAVVFFQCLSGLVVFNFGSPDPVKLHDRVSSGYSTEDIFATFAELFIESKGDGRKRR